MRADLYLVASGAARSRQAAKLLIESGYVILDGVRVKKPSELVDENAEHSLTVTDRPRYVSRGGEKLEYALSHFGIDVGGLACIDIGASTGGFTDCLLKHGAALVYAVDSGHSQLDASLAADERVISKEKYNARYMRSEDFPRKLELAVMDVSFISQTLIHGALAEVLADGGYLISLVKPQFECGPRALNSHGVVKDAADHRRAVERVRESAAAAGFSCLGVVTSPIEGGSGNTEFLMLMRKELGTE